MRIAIIMQHFKIHGGNEALAYSLAEALNKRGIIPDIYTRINYPGEEETMEDEIRQMFSKDIKFNKKTFFSDRTWLIPKRWKKSLAIFIAIELFLKRQYDFIYDFQEGPIYFFNKGRYLKYCNQFNYDVLKKRGFLHGIFLRAFKKGRFKMAINSRFSQEDALKRFKKRIEVIYPPVNIGLWKSDLRGKRDGLVSFGRFASYKRQLELVKIAEALDARLSIGGAVTEEDYFRKVDDIAKKVKKVKLYPNVKTLDFKRIMDKALIYIHGMENEPFGIATAEAIANGLIPVVPDSGGQREIVPIPELRYKSTADAIMIIGKLLRDRKYCDKFRARLMSHIKMFDESVYQEKMVGYL